MPSGGQYGTSSRGLVPSFPCGAEWPAQASGRQRLTFQETGVPEDSIVADALYR